MALTADWDRPVDTSIFTVRAKEDVPKQDIVTELRPWLAAAGFTIGEDYEIEGMALGKRFIERFMGVMGAAERKVAAAHNALRDQHGTWRSFAIRAPGNRRVDVFVSVDKNRGTVVRETSTKKVRAALSEKLGKAVHADRDTGICSIQWEPVAKVIVSPTEPVRVQWNLAALADLGVSRREMDDLVTSLFQRPRATWSS